MHTRCIANGGEQVANLLCDQANSASYPPLAYRLSELAQCWLCDEGLVDRPGKALDIAAVFYPHLQ